MVARSSPADTSVPAAARPSRRSLRFAWFSVAILPLAFGAGMLVGEGLQSIQGYGTGASAQMPIAKMLPAGIPAVLVTLAPTVPAVVFGLRARQQGAKSGIVPALIAIVVATFTISTNALAPLLGG